MDKNNNKQITGFFDKEVAEEFKLYKELYSLPTKHSFIRDTPNPFFIYCQKRRFFIILFIYTHRYEIYVAPKLHSKFVITEKDTLSQNSNYEKMMLKLTDKKENNKYNFSNGNYTIDICSPLLNHLSPQIFNDLPLNNSLFQQAIYSLPSGGVKIYDMRESIIEAVQRIANKELKGASIGEARPIMHFENHYYTSDNKYHSHEGIAFTCYLSHSSNDFFNKRSEKTEGILVDINSINDNLFCHGIERLTFLKGKEIHKNKYIDPNTIETEASQSIKYRIAIHNYIMKPIFNFVFRKSKIKNIIYNEIKQSTIDNKPIKYLDVSCGEDRSLFNINEKLPKNSIIIGNDVSLVSLKILTEYKILKKIKNIFLTNHAAPDLPYTDNYFDISICKNSLHHMRDYNEICKTIVHLIRVTKNKIIILDCEDPKHTGRVSKLLNKYYINFLKDTGRNFLLGEEFKKLFEEEEIKNIINQKGMKIKLDQIHTNFADFLIAIIN
ncbi:MAG: methyltransferase domain-containing protein [bacterium]|nr:methyltransferase domain-containing protein [bacterium]